MSTDKPILLGIDVHGIQNYLFATSKLKEVVGASRIVDDFTGASDEDVPATVLRGLGLSLCGSGKPAGDKWFLPVRLGGGVVRLLLPNGALAKRFVRCMSEWALQNAAGLEFDAASVEFDIVSGSFAEANAALIAKIHQHRQAGARGGAFNGFPFTAPCRLTGDAAEGYDGPNERLCAASLDKRAYQARRDDRWVSVRDAEILKAFRIDDPRRPFVFDLQTMQADDPSDSYMAVVAVDLNSLGELGQRAVEGSAGVDSLHRMRAFADRVTEAVRSAFSTALDALARNAESGHEFQAIERLVNATGKLPLRPLVLGGDDLIFVMHGSLAPRFAEQLASSLEISGFSSGIGIAFAKTSSPLARAIDLAEALLARAKQAGRATTHIDLMLCPAEIPADTASRSASGSRRQRGPYSLRAFVALRENATILKQELPSSHVRGAVDGFQQSLDEGRELLKDLVENIDRGLGDANRASGAARDLLARIAKDDALAASYLDCVDLFRFIAARPERGGRGAPDALLRKANS